MADPKTTFIDAVVALFLVEMEDRFQIPEGLSEEYEAELRAHWSNLGYAIAESLYDATTRLVAVAIPFAIGESISHGVGVPFARGQRAFDAGGYGSGNWTWRMVGWVSGPTAPLTVRARLYNLTDGEYVTGADVTTTATTATKAVSAALIVGSGAGDLQDTEKVYEVRLELTGSADALDAAHFGSVDLVRA